MPTPLRFGAFELDTTTGELRKHGLRLKLSSQPFQVLCALLEKPGGLVTREALRQRLWPGDTAGDFEQGLNRAVSRLREVLSDTAANPRFVETLPGRGYRFIGVLEGRKEISDGVSRHASRRLILVLAVLVVAAGVTLIARLLAPPAIPPLKWRKLTTDNYSKTPPALSDGSRIYFAASFGGEQFIAQVPLSGGQPSRVPITPPGPVFALHDLSPDNQELLVTAAANGNRLRDMPLWTLRIADGSARRLGSITATSAAYAESGKLIAFSNATELWVAGRDGSQPRRLLQSKESLLGSVCWSPDERRIRFSRRDPLTNHATPWEIGADGSGLRRVFPGWSDKSLIPSGWLSDVRISLFVGEGTVWGASEGWSSFRSALPKPQLLVEDAPELGGAIRQRGGVLPVTGTDRLGELQRYDSSLRGWTPLLEGISAEAVEYSPDLRRVAYITYPQKVLWIRQSDGSRPIQLTSPPLGAAFPRWAPDGKRIAFSATEAADKPMRLYVVDADGGPVRLAVPSESGSQGYPTWSNDGKSLLYGIINSSTREEVYIRVADLDTGKKSKLQGSEGLFAPRWSPDGKTIAALQWEGGHHLMLFRVAGKRWEEVTGGRVDWPTWAADGESILCRRGDVLMRYRMDTGRFEHVADLKADELGGHWRWIGIGPDGSPLRTLNRDNRQVYALEFE